MSSLMVTSEGGIYLIGVDQIPALTAAGLSLLDDGGNLGVFIENGGQVGVGLNDPVQPLEVAGNIYSRNNIDAGVFITVDQESGGSGAYAYLGAQTHNDSVYLRQFGENHASWPKTSMILFSDHLVFFRVSTEIARFNPAGSLLIGDTSNANMTIGVSIDQRENDDEIMAFKSTGDVDHGATNLAETSVFGAIQKSSSQGGGLRIRGLRDTDGTGTTGLQLQGVVAKDVDTGKSITGRSLVELVGYQSSGADFGAVVAEGNVVGMRARVGGSVETLWILDIDGDTWQSGQLTSHIQSNTDVVNLKIIAQPLATPNIPYGAIEFWGSIDIVTTSFNSALIKSGFVAGAGFDKAYLTFSNATGVGTYADVLTIRNARLGIGTANPLVGIHSVTSPVAIAWGDGNNRNTSIYHRIDFVDADLTTGLSGLFGVEQFWNDNNGPNTKNVNATFFNLTLASPLGTFFGGGTHRAMVGQLTLASPTGSVCTTVGMQGKIYLSADQSGTVTGTHTAIESFLQGQVTGITNVSRLNAFKSNVSLGGGNLTVTDLYHVTLPNASGSGTLTNQYGIWIANLNEGTTVNLAIVLDGDGAGSEIVFGGGQDASIYYDGTDLFIDTSLVAASDLLIDCGTDKTIELQETVWDDLRVALVRGQTGASNPPTGAQLIDDGAGSVGVFAFAFADQAVQGNEEQMFFAAQLPHTYKEGTDLVAHIHWTPRVGGAAGEFVKWGLEYTWQDVDAVFDTSTIITSNASSAGTATTSGDGTLIVDKHYVSLLGTIDGSGRKISSMLVCRIFRNSSHADDDLTEDAFALEVDFHFEVNTMGSRQGFTK